MYIAAAGLRLLTFLGFTGEKKSWQRLLPGSWTFMFFLPGIYPLFPVLPSPAIGLSIVGASFMITLFVCVIIEPEPRNQPLSILT